MVGKVGTIMSESRVTTAIGYVTLVIGILLPGDAGKTCLAAVTDSTSPLAAGIALGVGAILTGLGPSLKPKKSLENLSDTKLTKD